MRLGGMSDGMGDAIPISDTGKLLLFVLTLGYIVSILVPSAPWLLALVPGRCETTALMT